MSTRDGTRRALWGALALTGALYLVPGASIFAWPLLLLSTLAHEMGHGLTAVALGGEFERFFLYANGSGLAVWRGDLGRFGAAAVAAGGLVGPAVAASGLFVIAGRARGAKATLVALGLLLILADLWLVRNLFGLAFVGATGAIAATIGLRASEDAARVTLTFVAGQLSLAVFSRSDYLFTAEAHTGHGVVPSDVAHMAQALWLPYWFWGACCGLFSLAVLAAGTRSFLARV
jgi:hypothetical protein